MRVQFKNETRVVISIKEIEQGKPNAKAGRTKSLTVYETTIQEVYDIILEALKKEVK